ncbi:MAG: amidohydrolase [Candidatus Marinimicrobia bacterium]|jgi:5-methylthioadenosine/S-adenosylhomocysteine deaminase|nr:amidohydrolase [Candidatus Neomarinimicrobiota bacterium]MBT3633828.1 amidohydrolase [Candidatus Neomarinimicrobiota bacterium]MBT3682620.1 amidohydrolase [Candidatus Neomarinimicrobiota bacterium]MBT3759384.1 amidohydrolase [Candidatus Neomarinimicrobiota bacterium]MBT3894608.1 amidohydrolase [Candidatus Neomarinimicrobiota bacterium]
MSILIKNTRLKNSETDILIIDDRIKEIGCDIHKSADTVVDGRDTAVIPSFINAHSHSAMTYFRGYGDDMNLMEWLQTKIWPNETRLTEELVYLGARLACLEMIRSGITFFNDMYWYPKGVARAVDEMGMRSAVNAVFIDMFDLERAKEQIAGNKRLFEEFNQYSNKVFMALGPHAIYTVSEHSLKWAADFAKSNDLMLQIHLSETEQEVKDCQSTHGVSPIKYLDNIGFLSNKVVAAHCIYVSNEDIQILAGNGVHVAYNPISNMKLSVNKQFPYPEFVDAGVNICLGTDGVSSNNNHSMFDTMKTAALLQKHHNDPTCLPARACFDMATVNGYDCFDLDGGVISKGKLADLALIRLDVPEMIPCHDLYSNLVYSANSHCVDTVICGGDILMHKGQVRNESVIMDEFKTGLNSFLSTD